MEILTAKEVQDKLTGIVDELRKRTNGPEGGDLTDVVAAIATPGRETTTIKTEPDNTNYTLKLTATNNQATGYVIEDLDKNTDEKIVTLSVNEPTIDEHGNVTVVATAKDNSTPPVEVSNTNTELALGVATLIEPTVSLAGTYIAVEPWVTAGYTKNVLTDYYLFKANDIEPNLDESNIRKDAILFGLRGTYEGEVSINTCIVDIRFSITPNDPIIGATTLTNGAISNYYNRPANATGTITIPNVVCGSALSVYVGDHSSLYGWSHGYNSNTYSTSYVLFVPTSEGIYTAEIGAFDD